MRGISALLVFVMLVGIAHAETPQLQLTTTLQNLAKSKEAEAQLKKKLADTEREMQAMRERSADLAEQLQRSERRVTQEEDALAKANAEYDKKRVEFEQRKAEYTATVTGLLRMRTLPATAIFSSKEETQNLLRTASMLEKTNQAVATKAARLRTDMAQIKQLRSKAKEHDISTKAETAKLNAEQQKLDRELGARQKLQARLNADHDRAEAKVAELSRASQSLQELIGKLAENEKENAKVSPKPTAKLRNFDGAKGSARAPVAGEVIHRFGDKQNANGTYRGMVFKARPGAAVVAPFDGEIVFTGPFRDYGNMVLIKHKNGYISLVAGLGKVSTSLNQAAIRGEPIGTMPAAGSGEVYVELRGTDAKPIDPADWFANVVGK
ncbi:MAG: murein hydrolase activator EnvC family protein [Rickettsiales bacterium]